MEDPSSRSPLWLTRDLSREVRGIFGRRTLSVEIDSVACVEDLTSLLVDELAGGKDLGVGVLK
jgi:hypothetical protein